MKWFSALLAVLIPAAVSATVPVPETATEPSGVVLILPFSTPAGAKDAWMGRAVQQDLIADLTQGTHTVIEAPSNAAPAADVGQAIKTARSLGASIVVYGQVQSTATEVRLTGQVVDVRTAYALGSLKATGPSADLFHLEDALAGQTLVALPRSMLNPNVLQAMQKPQAQPPVTQQETAEPPPVEQPPPLTDTYTYVSPPPYYPTYTYPDYSHDYTYGCPVPAYSYACPSIGAFPFVGVFGFIGGDFDDFGRHHHNHDHDHDHDHDGDGFHHHWDTAAHASHGGIAQTGHGMIGRTHGGFVAGGRSLAGPRVHSYAPRQRFSYSPRPSIGYRSAPAAGAIRSYHAGGFSHPDAFHSSGFHPSGPGGFHGGGFHSAAGSHMTGGARR
ncbi:MAG TPA: hypothetical protein VN541_04070 [Tepidisphaeraceae bacterium]|nr:hypothetical protein [Tepidisphaeraceae bacterium]